MTIGEIIYQNRKKAGLSQEELANQLNVTRQSISLWETDQSIPTTEKLICLADIFEISMDELCARNSSSPHSPIKTKGYIAVSEIDYDEALYRRIYRMTFQQTRALSVLSLILCLFWIGFSLWSDMKWTALFPACLVLCLIIWLISIEKSIKTNVAAQMNAHPHHKLRICFFAGHIEVESASDTSSAFYQKTYAELGQTLFDGEYLMLRFDNLLAPVPKASLGDQQSTITNLLGLTEKARLGKQERKERNWLLAVFFLTCFTLHLALAAVALVTEMSGGFTLELFNQNMWIFYCFTPIPILSIVLGFVYKKRVRCKKNVVAGCIVLLLLLIYGSFPFFATVSAPETGAAVLRLAEKLF